MRTPSALILRSLLLAGLISCGGDGNGPNGTPKPGAIQGTLTSTAGAPIANASLQLLKADKSLLRATTTAANGTYGFLDVAPGNYFVRAHPPAGYAIEPASDSLRAVQVAAGQTATVSLTVAGLTQAMDSVHAGQSDTLGLVSGAVAVVQLPGNVASASLRLNDTIVALPPEFQAAGSSLSLTYRSAAATSSFNDPPAAITLSVPVSGPAPVGGGEWVLYGQIYVDGQLEAEGPLVSTIGPSPTPTPGKVGRTLALTANYAPPATGNTQVVASLSTSGPSCLGLPVLYPDAADNQPLGTRKALILIHGIQLDHVFCTQVRLFNPATSTFGVLTPLIQQDPEFRSTYKLYFYKYPSFSSISSNGDELATQMQAAGLTGVRDRVVILAHSMGGLIARRALNDVSVYSAVERLVTLATPHFGTENADQGVDKSGMAVVGCYKTVFASSLSPGQKNSSRFVHWWVWSLVSSLLNQQSAGVDDLGTGSTVVQTGLRVVDAKVIPLAGRINLNSINHGPSKGERLVSSGLLQLGCILESVNGVFDHDGTVPFISALPTALAGDPLSAYYVGLDHVDMTGGGLTPSQPLLDHVLDLVRRGTAHDLQLVSGDGQTAPAGSALSQPIVVEALDQYGIGVAGITVTFSVTQGGGDFGGQAQVDRVTDQHGLTSINWTMGPQPGANMAAAAAESRPGVSLGGSPVTFAATSTSTAGFSQQGPKLVGDDATADAHQGVSVSLSADGNTAIIGGVGDNNFAGAAWIWTRSGNVWAQQGTKLVGSGSVGNAYQGNSVALAADGNTAIVGGFEDSIEVGAAWIWTRTGGVWTQQGTKLVGSGAVGGIPFQGWSVAISADGNTVLVGGVDDSSDVGAAWVWTKTAGVWTQQGSKLVGSGTVGSQQGYSVALSADGNTAIVGGHRDNGNAGAAWVWTRSAGVWTEQGKLVGSDAVGNAYQGSSVSLSADGNTAIIGGREDNGALGAAWVWTRTGGVWTQQGPKLVGSGSVANSLQGRSVSLSADGNTAIIGGDNSSTGAAWIWTRSGGVWTQQGLKLVGTGAAGNAGQGYSVSISGDGNTVILGGPVDSNFLGAAWVFTAGP